MQVISFLVKGLILEAPHVFVEEITINEIKNIKKIWKINNLKKKSLANITMILKKPLSHGVMFGYQKNFLNGI